MSIKFLNGIDVDNGVLYTDTSNNRVGINTSSPQVPLEVKYTGISRRNSKNSRYCFW